MKSEWKEYRLGDLLDVKGGKRLPLGSNLTKEKNNHPYIRVRDLGNSKNIYLNSNFEYVDNETQKQISRYTVNTNDIIISIVGTIGLIGKIDKSLNNANLTENCVKLIDLKGIDYEYLYYYLSSNIGQHEISKGTVGAVQAKLPIKNIRDIPVKLPPLPEQKRIAEILSSLDDKIELNNKINKNLEEMAQAIFKQWFVDFDFPDENGNPYKSAGGKMIQSELGEIPEGWSVKELGDITVEIRERVKSKECKVFSAINTGKLQLSDDYFTKQVYSKDISKYIEVKKNHYAYNPARINIGSIGMNDLDILGAVSSVYVVFKTENNYHYYFNFIRQMTKFKQGVITRCSGSVRQSLSYKDFSLIKVVYPKPDIVKLFNEKYEEIITKQKNINNENSNLSGLRDLLLPKLMSGEMRVKN